MILVDTSIWSLAFRRPRADESESIEVQALHLLIRQDWPVSVPGVVLQELLSGLREKAQFERLELRMEGFPVVLASRGDHVEAAKILNRCRSKGVTCASIDSLIAAMAIGRDASLFTMDKDFEHIAQHTSLKIFSAD